MYDHTTVQHFSTTFIENWSMVLTAVLAGSVESAELS